MASLQHRSGYRTRRAFLRDGALWMLAGTCVAHRATAAAPDKPALRIGLLTDMHYADKEAAGTRYYRETLPKLAEAVARFREERPKFVVELGDFIDSVRDVDGDQQHLATIRDALAKAPGDKHYVLGNHCVETLIKAEFLDVVGRDEAHYSFDAGGLHFVVLDSCYTSAGTAYGRGNSEWTDANVPAAQIEWLRADLKRADAPAIVFAHQRLDEARRHTVRNAVAVRDVLRQSGNVWAVFQGHSHGNDYQQIDGIHYCTLAAMVEGSGAERSSYAMLDAFDDGRLRLSGFRQQKSYGWETPKQA